jgi:hypothetical protein
MEQIHPTPIANRPPLLRRLPPPRSQHRRVLVRIGASRRGFRVPPAVLLLRLWLQQRLPAPRYVVGRRRGMQQRPEVALQIVGKFQKVTLRHNLPPWRSQPSTGRAHKSRSRYPFNVERLAKLRDLDRVATRRPDSPFGDNNVGVAITEAMTHPSASPKPLPAAACA